MKSAHELFDKQLALASGENVDEAAMYDEFHASWLAMCQAQKAAVKAAEAKLEVAKFEADAAKALYEKKAICYKQILEKRFGRDSAITVLQSRQRLDMRCAKSCCLSRRTSAKSR